MSTQFDQYSDVIDSRDVLERITEIAEYDPETPEESHELHAEYEELLRLVEQLRNVGEDSPEDGQTLVRDSYFMNYAQELADELGALPAEYVWPISCIDWEQAARELRMDYTPVEFYGVTYWVR